jgi:hypothetical protein
LTSVLSPYLRCSAVRPYTSGAFFEFISIVESSRLCLVSPPENILEGWKKHFETLATPAENDTKNYTNTEFGSHEVKIYKKDRRDLLPLYQKRHKFNQYPAEVK